MRHLKKSQLRISPLVTDKFDLLWDFVWKWHQWNCLQKQTEQLSSEWTNTKILNPGSLWRIHHSCCYKSVLQSFWYIWTHLDWTSIELTAFGLHKCWVVTIQPLGSPGLYYTLIQLWKWVSSSFCLKWGASTQGCIDLDLRLHRKQ